MKTFEDSAKEFYAGYAFCDRDRRFAEIHFADGAEWMHKELTRWRDPKEELPEEECRVLIKFRVPGGTLQQVAIHRNGQWLYTFNYRIVPTPVIGWRPIYEQK